MPTKDCIATYQRRKQAILILAVGMIIVSIMAAIVY